MASLMLDENAPDPVGLDDEDLRLICAREIGVAEDRAAELSTDRQTALDYYRGSNLWKSKAGTSNVVDRSVLETVEWLMPQLLKVFASSDEIVRYEPHGPEDEEKAAQATDFANFIWDKQNAGFLNLHTWVKDSLLVRLGVLKIWWEDKPKVTDHDLFGVSLNQLITLTQQPGIEITAATPADPVMGPMGPIELFDVRLTLTEPDGRCRIEPVPSEEYIWLPSCKSAIDPGQGHKRRISQADLIAEGYDEAIVDDLPGADEDDDNAERSHRFYPGTLDEIPRDSRDRASRMIEVTEWYTRLDRNGDGRPEFLKVTLAGINHSVLLDSAEVDMPPFAVLSPILMSHRLDGLSIPDIMKDLQEIKTAITRQALDSLYLANKPRTWAVDGQVNIPELMNHAAGGVVRVKAPGMVGELNTQFVAGQAFPMLEYIDKTLETRSGISKLAQGIDADVLRGGGGAAAQTATGIAALQSAAAVRVELIARVMAETGIKHAFRLILRLVTKYQQAGKVIRLRNQWIEMNPADWDADYDVSTEVGLGTGNKMEQLASLGEIKAAQEAILQQGGLGGMVTPAEYYHTLAQMVRLSGFKNADQFFKDPSQQPAQPPGPPPPDPNAQLLQLQAQVEQQKLMLQAEKMRREDDLARDKFDADNAFRAAELQAKYGTQFNMAALQAQVDRDREAMRQQGQLAQQAAQPMQQQAQPMQQPPGMMQ